MHKVHINDNIFQDLNILLLRKLHLHVDIKLVINFLHSIGLIVAKLLKIYVTCLLMLRLIICLMLLYSLGRIRWLLL